MSNYAERIAALPPDKLEILARRLRMKAEQASGAQAIPRRAESATHPPASFAQQRLWLVEQIAPGNPAFNMPLAVRLRGRLDVAALEASLGEVVRRHESLRTTFVSVDGQPAQVVAPPRGVSLPLLDLRSIPEDEREREVKRVMRAEVLRPFDLSAGPLWRALLARLSDEEHVALFTTHHIISDRWSMDVLVREVATLYEAFAQGRPSPLEELPVQYADYAAWQREWLQGEVLESQLSYWRERLRELPTLALPTDRPRTNARTPLGAAHRLSVPEEVTAKLKALARQEGATLFMVLLAGLAALLSRYTGQEDVVVGTPMANRRRAELEGLIGFFVNALVLRVSTDGNPTFRELTRRAREACLGAYAHQDVPFERLVEELQPERSPGLMPLFQVALVLQNVPVKELSIEGLSIEALDIGAETARFDLALMMHEEGGGLGGALVYSTDLFDAPTVARLAGYLQELLREVAGDPDKTLAALSMVPEDERRQLAQDFNDELE